MLKDADEKDMALDLMLPSPIANERINPYSTSSSVSFADPKSSKSDSFSYCMSKSHELKGDTILNQVT